MRVAWYSASSLESQKSGLIRSAYFTAQVAPVLRSVHGWEIEFFVDDVDCLPADDAIEIASSRHHHLSAFRRHRENPFDLFVYQLEDHPALSFVRKVIGIYPGLVVFHDLNFSRMQFVELDEARSDVVADGDDSSSESIKHDEWKQRGWSTELVTARSPFQARAFSEASVISVRNIHAAHQVRAHKPEAIIELSRFVTAVVCDEDRERERRNIRSKTIPDSAFVVGFDSRNLLEEKGRSILEALSEWHLKDASHYLLWVASSKEAFDTAVRFCARLSDEVRQRVCVYHPRDWKEFGETISASDVWLAPRFDVLRETPASIPLALARGIPVICSDFGPSSELPKSVVMSVPPGVGERETFLRCVEQLEEDSELRLELSHAGRRFSSEHFQVQAAASDIVSIAERNVAQISAHLTSRSAMYDRAEQQLIDTFQNFAEPLGVFATSQEIRK